MLGGSIYVAIIRLGISLLGTVWLYTLLDDTRFSRKGAMFYYGCFCVAVIVMLCIWYVINWSSFVRLAVPSAFTLFSLLSIYMSNSHIYLTFYKLAFTFYLVGIFIIIGIEIATLFFGGNVWADIIVRILTILLFGFLIRKYLRDSIKGFGAYVESEMDGFSVAVLIISVLLGIGFVLKPLGGEVTFYRLYQIVTNLFLTATLQLMSFRFYLHIGRESEYQRENQLMQMNHRLLERQLELLEESVESGRRIRHDMRHHNTVIAEYARRGQIDELLEYLKAYKEETDKGMVEVICANTAVNNILSAYTRRAEKEQIKVALDVELEKDFAIPDIDMVTILSNAYENAIYGCLEARKQQDCRESFINILVKRKKNKLVICCRNTCRMETDFKKGQPKPEFTGGIGVSSIIKTAENYGGEYDFKNDDGVFVFRLLMNLPPKAADAPVDTSILRM